MCVVWGWTVYAHLLNTGKIKAFLRGDPSREALGIQKRLHPYPCGSKMAELLLIKVF